MVIQNDCVDASPWCLNRLIVLIEPDHPQQFQGNLAIMWRSIALLLFAHRQAQWRKHQVGDDARVY